MFFQDDDNYVPIVGVVFSVLLATIAVVVGVAITGKDDTSQPAAAAIAAEGTTNATGLSGAAAVPAVVQQAAAQVAATAADAAHVVIQGNDYKFYFASGKSDLATNADTALQQIAAALKAGHTATISGFHDETGSAALNANLAKRRAEAVRNGLTALGAPSDRMELKKPEAITSGASPAEARRVEVVVK
jgi:outer membrane protein OmpA-like peptidoglycan-associated protein